MISFPKPGGKILDILEKTYPDARLLLNFNSPLELLIATMLAAQCTDERVNEVTKTLFTKYRSASDFANAPLSELEKDIKPTGFYKNKAKNIITCCREIISRYNGNVPSSFDELIKLPGVGRKTANVVLSNVFKIPSIAVDTHVARVTKRIGLVSSNDPDKIEEELKNIIPKQKWTRATHLISFHGRKICVARKPKCSICPIEKYCEKNL